MLAKERLTAGSYLNNRKGMALYLVLAVLVVTAIVAGMFLNLILSNSRLTHHTVSRSQAYFAAKLGMNYAIEMLSHNEPGWTDATAFDRTICRPDRGPCDKEEPDLPAAINNITIHVGALGTGLLGTRDLNITVDYRYEQS